MPDPDFTPATRPSREESMARLMKGASRIAHFTRSMPYTTADRLEERARDSAERPFIIFEDREITYAQANQMADRIAHAARDAGFSRGDVIALLMENRPEFVLVWLGLAKAGIIAALINTSATGPVLAHALQQVEAKAIIVGSECLDALATLDPPLSIPAWEMTEPGQARQGGDGVRDFNAMLAAAAATPAPAAWRSGIVAADPLYLIYTSGTTGLPKAARMSHLRFLNSGEMMGGIMAFDRNDVFYCVLPLYHGAGGMVVPSAALAFGIPFVLRRKFSRSKFWDDVRRHKITAMYYIGEIIRFLLASPAQPDERAHTLRKMAGAGLKPNIWREFVERFGIESVIEGLGSTEANYGITNVDNVIGSVGRIPFPEYSNIRVVLWDTENGRHQRDAEGRLVLAQAGEVGELIAEVLDNDGVAGFFEGYTSPQATEAKLMRDVFRPGDCWVKSGDLVRFDEDGYFYFHDRTGDTFRWKSENVSTQEVETILSAFPGLDMINIYGVRVPGTEGRAGMAAVTMTPGVPFDPHAFYAFAQKRLATYAIPVFIRLSNAADMTTTFKLKKVALQRQGYNPQRCQEPVFIADHAAQTYVELSDKNLARLGFPPFDPEEA